MPAAGRGNANARHVTSDKGRTERPPASPAVLTVAHVQSIPNSKWWCTQVFAIVKLPALAGTQV